MIRQRIVKYLEYKGISKYKFYKDTGLSNGFLDKKGSIGVDKCELIISSYPDLNLYWLVLGTGSMLKDESNQGANDANNQELPVNNNELLDRIERLSAEKARLEDSIKQLGEGKKLEAPHRYSKVAEPKEKYDKKE